MLVIYGRSLGSCLECLRSLMGQKKLAVLLTEWPYYQGKLKFHDLRAVITNKPHIAFTVLFTVANNGNVDIAYSN